MEEQGKLNLREDALSAEQKTHEVQQTENSGESVNGANPPNTPTGAGQNAYTPNPPNGYPAQQGVPQYGYGSAVQGPPMPYQQPYGGGYPQQYSQQGNFRQSQSPRTFGSASQQNANGTGPGQYN